ncbi:MAG: MaoC family dehydratase [Candidatus Competibacteraceae bacterium]|nr:MaoC family dehydratase [Candidatus Competibacteraceae bacterium]MCB1812065.1 MaoC family dehydratase [Candidatus Competibacteraceae bacterium]
MSRYYFDDLTLGQRFRSEAVHVDESEIIAFARLYDPQSFHTDPELAKQTVFGGLLAPGLYTLCLSFGQWFRLNNWESFGSPGLDKLRWIKPLRPGDSLHVETEILSLRASQSKPDRGIVIFRHEAYNQNQELIMTLECTDFVRRRPTPASSGDSTENSTGDHHG